MAILLSLPILGALMILQTSVVVRIPLLHGTADLLLLAILAWALQERVKTAWHWAVVAGILTSFVSALPLGIPLLGYLLVVGLALLLRQRVWQVPFLAMLIATFFGTLVIQTISLLSLQATGSQIPWLTALNLFTLPSILLNLMLAVPTYALLTDLASWVYPEELDV